MARSSRDVAPARAPLPLRLLPGADLRRTCSGAGFTQSAPKRTIGRGADRHRHGARRRARCSLVTTTGDAGQRRHGSAPDPSTRHRLFAGAARDRHRRLGVATRSVLRHHRLRSGTAARHRPAARSLRGTGAGLACRPSERRRRQPRPRRTLRRGCAHRRSGGDAGCRSLASARQCLRGTAQRRRASPVRDQGRGEPLHARAFSHS